MNYHLRYWWAKLKNDWRQITLRRLDEETVVEQVMSGLKRNPELREIIEDHERRRAEGKNSSQSEKS